MYRSFLRAWKAAHNRLVPKFKKPGDSIGRTCGPRRPPIAPGSAPRAQLPPGRATASPRVAAAVNRSPATPNAGTVRCCGAGPALAGTQGADGRRLSGGTALPAGLRQAWAPCRRVCGSQAPVCGTIAVGRGPSRDGSVWGGAREPAFERGPRRRRGCWPWDHDGARTDRHGGRPALLWGRTGARGWPGRGRAGGGGEWVAGMLFTLPPPVHAAPAHAPLSARPRLPRTPLRFRTATLTPPKAAPPGSSARVNPTRQRPDFSVP